MSIESPCELPRIQAEEPVLILKAPGFPEPDPDSPDPDTFARQTGVPGHKQEVLEQARVTFVGAGGLNSWNALGLVRSGLRFPTIIDPDLIERTNLTRQLYYAEDLTRPKAHCLAQNLLLHMTAGGVVTAIASSFEAALDEYPLATDLLVVGVDNNACRLEAVRFARERGIPAVFSMLSLDGTRTQCFLQGAAEDDPCLWCALPNLDPETRLPCAAAVISSCFLASAFTQFFAHRALMGWPENSEPFNWREADLTGMQPSHIGHIRRRDQCDACFTHDSLDNPTPFR